MSYRVLARAYRSNTFDEVVGQEAIATTLKNAIATNRVHHGYLFCGTRGVGKTTMARVLAKALNCLAYDGPTTTPCCKCDVCTLTASGEDVDVVEIDAASNTGVESIRDLRSNASLRPARGRYKIYIIDEVHMLSTQAFNALLKTLEEPPAHVKFILATTEIHKVPATIQSRCQRFDFRAIDAATIAAQLGRILAAEGVKAEDAVIRRIARLANGSMRDALSLLDKVLAYESKNLTTAVAEELLPPSHDELAFNLMAAVVRQEGAEALKALEAALQSGYTLERFCDALLEHLRTLMLIRVCGKETELADVPSTLRGPLAEQASAFDAATYVYMINLVEELRRHVKWSGVARPLADAMVMRLAMSAQFSDLASLLERIEGGETSAERVVPPVPRATPSSHAEPSPRKPAVMSGESRRPASSTPTSRAAPREESNVARDLSEDAARDPLVARVREAVEGTLFDVKPASGRRRTAKQHDESTIEGESAGQP